MDDKELDYFPDYKVKRDPWSKVCASDNWTYSSLDFLGGRKGLTDEFITE